MESEFLSDFDTVKIYWPNSEELNRQLKKEILVEEKKDPQGMRVTNHGGWHSKWVVQDWKTSCGKDLIARLHTAKEEMEKHVGPSDKNLELEHAWININREGCHNYPHYHNSYWSGFYCVDTGNPDPSHEMNGTTGLVKDSDGNDIKKLPWHVHARPGNVGNAVKEYIHPATAGSLLIFPGKLLHYVSPYHGDGTRITIAFNFL